MTPVVQRQGFAKLLFLGEIEFQVQCAAKAAERLAAREARGDHIEIWSAIQSVLIAAANVSKILWPTRQEFVPRGAMMRELLGIDDNNPLSNRRFRNHFEHYDERIEEWLATVHSASYVDQVFGPPSGFLGQFPQNVNRGYDPSTLALTFRGETMDLASILKALDAIRQQCRSIVYF